MEGAGTLSGLLRLSPEFWKHSAFDAHMHHDGVLN